MPPSTVPPKFDLSGPLRVLVTGGRDFTNWCAVDMALDAIDRKYGIRDIIHGACRGADSLADNWAISHGIRPMRYPVTPADWRKYGRSAVPKRNRFMVLDSMPDIAVAFPGGSGTADCVSECVKNGVPVWNIAEDEGWMKRIRGMENASLISTGRWCSPLLSAP